MTQKEKLQFRLDEMKRKGVVDFKFDLDIYEIAKKHMLGIKLETNYFGLPVPKLDFTNAFVTQQEVMEDICLGLNKMLDAIEDQKIESFSFGDGFGTVPRSEILPPGARYDIGKLARLLDQGVEFELAQQQCIIFIDGFVL